MIQIIFLLVAIASQSVFEVAQGHKHKGPPQPKNIFILAGQSNMAGRGGVVHGVWNGIVPLECQSNRKIFRLSACLKWERAKVPLHKDIDANTTCGIGPGMSFANTLLQKDPRMGSIGLVPCAMGGTKISQWKHGSDLYNQLIRRANASIKSGGVIKAMLWYQGESDTGNHDDAMCYKKNYETFLKDVRADLRLPTLPIIQVPLSSSDGQFLEVIKKVQLGLHLSNVWSVHPRGFHTNPDHIHLNTSSQVKLGRMLARTFLQIPTKKL